MYTDLFRALKNPGNPRGHPLLAGLLYAFCPAAAKWWLAGAEPVIPFDPVWQALNDHTEGKECQQALIEYGFESELDRAERFLLNVEEFRQSFDKVRAPEATPLFNLDEPNASERFGIQSAIEKFGGSFMNFYSYLRARYFLIPDWKSNSGASEKVVVEFKNIPVHFMLNIVRKPVQWETWTMIAETGNVSRYQVGLLTSGLEQDAVRFFLTRFAMPAHGTWPTIPEVVALDRVTGEVGKYEPRASVEQLQQHIERLIQLADYGPHPAIHALSQKSICQWCGFKAQCFTPKDELSPLLIKTYERKSA